MKNYYTETHEIFKNLGKEQTLISYNDGVLMINGNFYDIPRKSWQQLQKVRCTYQPMSKFLLEVAEHCSKNRVFDGMNTRNRFADKKSGVMEIFLSVKKRKSGRSFEFEYKSSKDIGMKVEVRSLCSMVWGLYVLTKDEISNDNLQKKSAQCQYMINSIVEMFEWMSLFSTTINGGDNDNIVDKRYLCFSYDEPERKSRRHNTIAKKSYQSDVCKDKGSYKASRRLSESDYAVELPFRDFLIETCGWVKAAPTLCGSVPDIIMGSCVFEIPTAFYED